MKTTDRKLFWEILDTKDDRIKFGIRKGNKLVKTYWARNEKGTFMGEDVPAEDSLRGDIRKAIIRKKFGDPKNRFKIQYINSIKREAEVFIVWNENDREVVGVNY